LVSWKTAAAQLKWVLGAKRQNQSIGSDPLSKAVKHHWYGDTSPLTEQRFENSYRWPQSSTVARVVILDRENPPQRRSDRAYKGED
jgi:hypothetical protein